VVPVPEKDLPVRLPEVQESSATDGSLNLKKFPEFLKAPCPKCGKEARRESDTLDTFLCSAWYAFRYCDNRNDDKVFESDRVNHFMPINFYVGGLEHAALHMIYFRFMTKFLHEKGLIDFDEPVDHFFCNGMVRKDGFKMSKSRGNVVIPDEAIDTFGADALRLYILSDTPAEQDIDWDDQGIKGKKDFVKRIFERLSAFLEENQSIPTKVGDLSKFPNQDFLYSFFGGLKNLDQTLETNLFHNAVAKMHEVSNALLKTANEAGQYSDEDKATFKALISDYLKVAGVLIPFASGTLYNDFLKADGDIYCCEWPRVEEKYLSKDEITVVIQVNGKKRAEISISKSAEEAEVKEKALALERVKAYTDGKNIVKFIYVKGKLVNLVVK
jgi:leucyl-tRNA synthetase